MGYLKFKRPLTVQTHNSSQGVPDFRGGLVQLEAYRIVGSQILGSSAVGAALAWNKTYLLTGDSSAGGASPRVFTMAAATSGDIVNVFVVSAASCNGVALRLQAGTSAMTFDGLLDQILFPLSFNAARIVALSSSKAGAILSGTSAMFTASTS